MITLLALTLGLVASDDGTAGDDEFNYYLTEFATNELPQGDPMGQLITDHLVNAVFNTSSSTSFENHIRQMKAIARSHPDKATRFSTLDSRLSIAFEEKLKEAKHKRLLYTAGGAVAGAVLGIPAGKLLANSTSMGSKILFITVPAGALAGAGAGYLLGGLIEVPNYSYESGTMTRDLGLLTQQMEDLEK